jgi:pimeloyl-ACP methyl ester carboxylesterase
MGDAMECRNHSVIRQGLTLHVSDWGPVTATPLVALHGIRGYGETFSGLAKALQPRFRLIALDQRGRGESDWDPDRNYYTDDYVGDVLAMVDHLGIDRFDLLGHSMGGINAIAFAARYPARVRRLIIEDAGPGAFENSAGAVRIRREFIETPSDFSHWDEASAFMRRLRPSVSEDARQQRLKNMLKPKAGGGFTWRYDHEGIRSVRLDPDATRLVDLRKHIPLIACPTLVVRGGNSDYLQPEMVAEMRGLNPLISDTVIPGAGHYVHDDQPDAFYQEVRAFLS